jgi:uncharacterized protein (DUF1499 family)
MFSFAGKRPPNLEDPKGHLTPCPSSPNCVSSDAGDDTHHVDPLRLVVPGEQAWPAVRTAVLALRGVHIVWETAVYLHAECRSTLFGFVDDLELLLHPDDNVIAVRSASRLGYSDLGVNRRRVEYLRTALAKRGIVG